MPAAAATAQSKRVKATISRMLATPRPSSPIIQPSAPRSSVSHEALETFPILRLSWLIWIGFLLPSGRHLGTRKQLRPRSV